MDKPPWRTFDFTSEPLWNPYLEDSRTSEASHDQHDDGLVDSVMSARPPRDQSEQLATTRHEGSPSLEFYPIFLDPDMASSRAVLRSRSDHLQVSEKYAYSSKTSDASSMSRTSTSSSLSITSSCEADALLCSVPGCPLTFTGRYRRGNLSRHVRQKHATRDGSKEYRCGTCEKTFLRPDALLKHSRKRHPELCLGPPVRRKYIR